MDGLRLAIDCGTTDTVAVTAAPGQPTSPVLFDSYPHLPSAVWVAPDTSLLTGYEALHHAGTDPLRLLAHPLLQLTAEPFPVAGAVIDPLDAVAATLRRVAAATVTSLGRITETVLVTPAGWGPRRQHLLRTAATRAGLPNPITVPAPVAITHQHTATTGHLLPPGGCVLVYHLTECTPTISVVQHSPHGLDVLATADVPDAGARDAEHALSAHLLGVLAGHDPALAARLGHPASPGDVQLRNAFDANSRHAIAVLSSAVSTVVPTPLPHLSITVDRAVLAGLVAPLADQLGEATVRVIAAADINPTHLHGRTAAGTGCHLAGLLDTVAAGTGIPIQVVHPANHAAAHGALHHPTATPTPAASAGVAPVRFRFDVRQYAGAGIALITALGLMVHALGTADIYGTPVSAAYIVIVNSGEYAIAAFTMAVAVVSAAIPVLGLPPPPGRPRMLARPLLLTAAGAVVAIAAVLGLVAAGKLGLPASQTLRWTLPAAIPVAVAVAACGLTATGRTATLPETTLRRLAFPLYALLAAAVGAFSIQAGYANLGGTRGATAAYLGAATLGVATGLLITPAGSPVVLRTVTAVLFAVAFALATTIHTTGALAAGYIVAGSAWWLLGAGHLTYQTLRTLTTTGNR